MVQNKILKKPNLCIFGLEFENIICHVSNQRPRICFVAKFGGKIKILKFRVKNALFGYFWAGIFKKKRLSYLKSGPSHLSNCKFCKKTKMSKFGTKNVLFGYFWVGIWKKCCHIWNQHLNLSNCKISWNNENAYIWDKKCLVWLFLG